MANGSDMPEAAQDALRALLASPQFAAGARITVAGHTDAAGSDPANLAAARRRANRRVGVRLVGPDVAGPADRQPTLAEELGD